MNNGVKFGKPNFRAAMTSLSFAQKVDQVIELQERLSPICAQRGVLVVPWEPDENYVILSDRRDEQFEFMQQLKSLVRDACLDGHMDDGNEKNFETVFATSTVVSGEVCHAN